MRALALGVLTAVALAGAGPAETVEPGAPKGARPTAGTERAFDSYDLPVAPFGLDKPAVQHLKGRVRWSAYRLDDPAATVASVMEGYRARLSELGFEPVFECSGAGCGGFDFRFGAAILPPPAMLVDVRDFAQLSARRAEPGAHVSVLVSRVHESIYVQTVSVVPAEAPVEVSAAPWPDTPSDEMILPQDQRALMAELTERGHVRVEGLDFDVGGARISQGSKRALDILAELLIRNPDLSVIIVGHSDNQGPLDANIELSQERANAVMQALIERGVPPGQLEARGIGFLAPVTSNATEEGRAANRRVELVLR